MPEHYTEQEQLFGEREIEYGTVTLSNGDLYPFLQLANALVSECKLRHDGETFRINAVGPANVAMVDVELSADTDLQTEFTIGLNSERLGGLLQNKPRGSDPVDVTLDLYRPYSTVSVENEYANGSVWNLTERFGLIDPDSIREEPDIPGLELETQADLPVGAIYDYLRTRPTDNSIRLSTFDGGLRVGQVGEGGGDDEVRYNSTMETADVAVDGDGAGIFSYGYLADVFGALANAGVETVGAKWDDEMPVELTFESGVLSGRYFVAPRLKA